MAFPTSPVDGQTYKDYRYSSAKSAWERLDPLNAEKISIDQQFEMVYNDTTDTLDFNHIGG